MGGEPFLNGVGSALRHIDEAGLTNVRLLAGDVRPLIDQLPDGFLERIFIMFPDPWPKARTSPARMMRLVVTMVSQATRASGSLLRNASTTTSEIRSATLSGWPSETLSEVKMYEGRMTGSTAH